MHVHLGANCGMWEGRVVLSDPTGPVDLGTIPAKPAVAWTDDHSLIAGVKWTGKVSTFSFSDSALDHGPLRAGRHFMTVWDGMRAADRQELLSSTAIATTGFKAGVEGAAGAGAETPLAEIARLGDMATALTRAQGLPQSDETDLLANEDATGETGEQGSPTDSTSPGSPDGLVLTESASSSGATTASTSSVAKQSDTSELFHIAALGTDPGGPASAELEALEQNYGQLASNLRTLADSIGELRKTVSAIKYILQPPLKIVKLSNEIESILETSKVTVKFLKVIPITRSVSTPLLNVLEAIQPKIKAIADKAEDIFNIDKLKAWAERLDAAKYLLQAYELAFKADAARAEVTQGYIKIANDALNSAHDFSHITSDATIKGTLDAAFLRVDTLAAATNASVEPINDALFAINNTTISLADIDLSAFDGLFDFQVDLDALLSKLDFLAAPLKLVYDAAKALEPLLGALSFILAPFEWALEKALEVTGIEALMDEAANLIASLLPDIDISFLEDLAAQLDQLMDIDFLPALDLDLIPDLEALLADIDLDLPFTDLGSVSSGDDVHLGSGSVFGGDGDDLLSGSDEADSLFGQNGADVLIGGPGNDLLHGGGVNGVDRDLAVYAGTLDNYAIARIWNDILGTDGAWRVTDRRSGGLAVDGTDLLIGIEDLVFADQSIAVGDIGNFIRTESEPFGGALVTTDESRPDFLQSTDIADIIYGDFGWDEIHAGDGDDTIIGVWNSDSTLAPEPGDWLFGEAGDDTIQVGNKFYDRIDGGAGDDTIVFADQTFTVADDGIDHFEPAGPARVFMPTGTAATLFRPSASILDDNFLDSAGRSSTFTTELVGIVQNVENIVGAQYDDYFWGTNGVNVINGGAGVDRIRGLGGNDTLLGDEGDDTLIGDRGNDLVIGGEGSDTFIGGLGNDQYQGGEGLFDWVSYGAIREAGDIIGNDFVEFEFDTTGFVSNNWDLPFRIEVNPGSAPGTMVVDKFDELGALLGQDGLTDVENLDGTDGNDIIHGAAGIEQLIRGGDGNDQIFAGDGLVTLVSTGPDEFEVTGSDLRGGKGSDTFVGGRGTDNIEGENGADTVIVSGDKPISSPGDFEDGLFRLGTETDTYFGGNGIDTLDLSGSAFSWHIYVLPISSRAAFGFLPLEAELLLPANEVRYIAVTRDPAQTYLLELTELPGKPVLDIKDLDATGIEALLEAAYGVDDASISVEILPPDVAGTDVFKISFAGELAGRDIGQWGVTGSPPGPIEIDPLIEGEQHIQGADEFYIQTPYGVPANLKDPNTGTINSGGRASVQDFEIFNGSQFRDIISIGNDGSTIMQAHGNGGDDVLFGGQRGEQLFGGTGNDILGTFNYTLEFDGGAMSLFDVAFTTLLDGGAGDDKFIAGDAQENFIGGDGLDTLTYETSTLAVTVNLASGTGQFGFAQGDTMSGIENLTGTWFADSLTGDTGANILIGWGGGDTIAGSAGDDVIFGNSGDDTLRGGNGNDELHGGAGIDTLNGGAGIDTASWDLFQQHPKGGPNSIDDSTSGITANIQTGVAGAETLVSIENLTGSAGDDLLLGDGGANVLSGGDGDDELKGRDGDDALIGGTGDDMMLGQNGDDWFSAGTGTNFADGGNGIDTLDYTTLNRGITLEMAGAGSRTGLDTGLVVSHHDVDWAVWADSVVLVPDLLGDPGDMVLSGTTEIRHTFQIISEIPVEASRCHARPVVQAGAGLCHDT